MQQEEVLAKCVGKLGGGGRLFKVEDRGNKQDLMPHCGGQVELASVAFGAWIFAPNIHGLFDDPCDVACLPTHYGVVHTDVMTYGVGMVTDGRRALRCFLSPSPKILADSLVFSSSQSCLSYMCL